MTPFQNLVDTVSYTAWLLEWNHDLHSLDAELSSILMTPRAAIFRVCLADKRVAVVVASSFRTVVSACERSCRLERGVQRRLSVMSWTMEENKVINPQAEIFILRSLAFWKAGKPGHFGHC